MWSFTLCFVDVHIHAVTKEWKERKHVAPKIFTELNNNIIVDFIHEH